MKESLGNDADSDEITASEKTELKRGELVGDFIFTFLFTFFALIAVIQVVLNFSGFTMLNVRTGSMEPDYPVNSLVFVKKIDTVEIAEGDVITFVIDEKGTLVTHRVVAVHSEKQTFTTKGDANNTEDGEVLWANVVGRVEFALPKVGYIFMVITDPGNRPIVIAVIAVLAGVSFVWEIAGKVWRKKRKEGKYAAK